MHRFDSFLSAPLAPLAIVLVALASYGAYRVYAHTRNRTRLAGQVLLYLFLGGLFALDFFLALKREDFQASWSATAWLALAAFVVGEWVGRWTSAFRAAEPREPRDAR